jgi:hypothetical protein
MSKVGSTSLKLIEKSYKSDIKGEWDGSFFKKIIFTQIYLEKKYSNLLHTIPWVNIRLDTLSYHTKKDKFNVHLADWDKLYAFKINNKEINLIDKYIKLYKETDKRYTYYPISTVSFYQDKQQDYGGHSLFFLYDKKFNKVKLFDSIRTELTNFKNDIKIFFNKIYGNNIKIIYPNKSYQTISELYEIKCENKVYNYTAEGFCIIWSLWYLEMILTNTQLSFNKISHKTLKLLNSKSDKICKIAIGYAQFIDNITKNYELVHDKNSISIILIKEKTKYQIPKILIGILGITGAILYIIKKISNRPKK